MNQPTGTDLVGAARRYVGTPYLFGGKTSAGLDCSGLIALALADLGVPFVHGSTAQIEACEPIDLETAWQTPGALLWREGHDAISTSTGTSIEAIRPAVTELARSETYDGGKVRFTRAGLIPGIDYTQEARVAVPSVKERVRSAESAVGKGSSFAGMCEKFTRGHFGFPARYASAKLAYEASARDGKITKSFDAPPGVPVFWDILTGKNAKYDHVAISVGDGYCISTSAGPGGTVAKVRIADLTRRWGMRYHGWGDVYHGHRVYDWPVKDSAPAPQPPAPLEDDDMTPEQYDLLVRQNAQALNDIKALNERLDALPNQIWSYRDPKVTPDHAYRHLLQNRSQADNIRRVVQEIVTHLRKG